MLRKWGLAVALLGFALLVSGPVRAGDDDAKMAAIGGLSASFLVQTYLNIGLVADASAQKDANKEQQEGVLTTVENLLGTTQKQLDDLLKGEIKDEDKAFLKKIKVCYAMLDEEISTLHAFWKDKSEENGKAFDQARQAAWKKISATLAIK